MERLKDKRIGCLLLIYGIIVIIFHVFFLQLGDGDDPYYMACLNDTTFWGILWERWNDWSSRVVIEALLILVVQQPAILWVVLDILISLLIGALTVRFVFEKKEDIQTPLVVLLLFLLLSYDFREMSSAGWMTTTINYWWSLAALLLVFLPLAPEITERGRKWAYAFAIPAAVFSVNHEQICLVVLCISAYVILREWFQKRRCSWYVCFLLGVSLVYLYIILTCPGNEIRRLTSIDVWFPGYAGFNLIQRGLLGWYSLLLTLYKDINWTYFLFTGVLFLAVASKRRRPWEYLAAGLPFASNAGLLVLKGIEPYCGIDLVHYIVNIFEYDQPVVWYQGYLPNKARLLMLIYTICCFCVVYSLFLLWGATERFLDMLMLLVSVTISKVSVGMSPTVWVSTERTSIFLNFGFLFLAMFCSLEWRKTAHSYFRQSFHKIK